MAFKYSLDKLIQLIPDKISFGLQGAGPGFRCKSNQNKNIFILKNYQQMLKQIFNFKS